MKIQLAILTRSFDFSSRQRFFLSFLFIFFSFFLSFLFIFFSLSLSFPRETVCQTVVCTEMTRTSDDKPTQEVSGPWQAFIYDPTSPLRTDEPVNRIYRWKWRSIAALCLESTIRAWEIIAPISHWIFFPPVSRAPQPFPSFSLLFSYSVGSIDASRTNSKRYVRLFKEMMVERKNFHRDTNFFFF